MHPITKSLQAAAQRRALRAVQIGEAEEEAIRALRTLAHLRHTDGDGSTRVQAEDAILRIRDLCETATRL